MMKTFLGKRAVAMLLALVMVLGLVPVVATPKTAAAVNHVDLKNMINSLQYPLAERITNKANIGGLCLVLGVGNASGTKTVMNPDKKTQTSQDFYGQTGTYNYYEVASVAVSSDEATARISDTKYVTYITSPSSGVYHFQTYMGYSRAWGDYWNFNAANLQSWFGDLTLGDSHNLRIEEPASGLYTVHSTTTPQGKQGMSLMASGWSFRVTYQPVDATRLYFYRISKEALELYAALKDATSYVYDNSDGRFDDGEHQAFLEELRTIAELYSSNESKSWSTQETVFAGKGKHVWDMMGKLKLKDSTVEYMDMPIEVYDFRGDGFLFEALDAWTTPYSLSRSAPDKNDSRFPGKFVKNDSLADDKTVNFQIENLIESTLVNGKVVYTQKTVDYIAYHLAQKTALKAPSDKMNGVFYNRVTQGMSSGSYADTLTKCTPNKPGGELPWGNVSTYHDLAYYLLSHMWSSAPNVIGQDRYADGSSADVTYNMQVTELSKLRLFKNGDIYTYESKRPSCYEHGYIFNDSTTRPTKDPFYGPVNGKGFEAPDKYGNRTEGSDYAPAEEMNYHFTVHAYGGFVYTEESNLYFDFGGDDDVYFFVNGQKVCDIGGIHGEVKKNIYLNDFAGALGLTDGQICRFDMFYAERHTTGINMNLSTNIRLMDETVIADKTQYDPATDLPIQDGSAVNSGTVIAYSFGMTNRRTGPVKELQFKDSVLKVTVSGNELTLNDLTAVDDLTLVYSGYNARTGEVSDGTPTAIGTLLDMVELVQGAVSTTDSGAPMGSKVYSYNPQSAEELMTLLAIGIPASCKLTVRGFRHKMEDGLFTNSLSTLCTPVQYVPTADGSFTEEWGEPISGVASCRCYGMSQQMIQAGDPYAVVLDYGKSVEMDLSKIADSLGVATGIQLTYMGATFNGEHGAVRTTKPINLTFTANGQKANTATGQYLMTSATKLKFTPTDFMNESNNFYAVYQVSIPSATNFTPYYIMKGVKILPATSVYYEAEDFTNVLQIYKKAGTEVQTEWTDANLKAEGSLGGELQDFTVPGQKVHIPDYRYRPEVLFFGFDNLPGDAERYKDPANGYGGTRNLNYDDPNQAANNWYMYEAQKIDSFRIDSAQGAMVITARENCGVAGATGGALYPDVYLDPIYGGVYGNYPLNYNPKNAEVLQVRFKMKNFRVGTDGNAANSPKVNPFINMQFVTLNGTKETWTANAHGNISPGFLNADEYVVMTTWVSDAFRNAGTIKKFRTFFGGIESISASQKGILTIDYIYIGPYESAPTPSSYGRDSSYCENTLLSDGQSLYVEGNGVRTGTDRDPKKLTEVSFSFTGTGFDILTCTGKEQGTLRVEVFRDEDRKTPVKILTVINKGELDKLYQIPTVSIRDLEHGKYYVSVMVNDATKTPLEFLNYGNQLYLDAIRIYGHIDVTAGIQNGATALDAYCADGEAYAVVQEVRNLLLPKDTFDRLKDTAKGAVYVDYGTAPTEVLPTEKPGDQPVTVKPNLDILNHVTQSVDTYEKAGPKNEVYLSANQMVGFKLVVKSNVLPAKLDVGVKILSGSPRFHANMFKSKQDTDWRLMLEQYLYSYSVQYYSIPLWAERFTPVKDGSGNITAYESYVLIGNSAGGVLSVTELKVGYDQQPTPLAGGTQTAAVAVGAKRATDVELPMDSFVPVEFVVDNSITRFMADYLENSDWAGCDHIPGYWETEVAAGPGQDGLEQRFCVKCGELMDEQFVEGTEALSFAGASVSLQSDLAIHYKVNESFFTEMGYSDPYVVINDNGTQVILRNYEIKDGKYAFIYKNIAPHRIGDTVTATLYATYNGELYCSASRDYSVADYCYNMLGKTEGIAAYDKLRTLLVDILLYGAKTQEYMSYRLDSLCTARLTEVQLACGTADCRELVNHRDQAYETIENPTVQWKGAGLNLRESVAIRFKIEAETYEDLEVRITLAGKTYVIKAKDFDHRTDGTYVHFKNINAAQMSEPVYVAVYRNGEQVSHTICYSIESYAYSKQNDSIPHLADLVKRMMCYGDSTRAYVGQ